MSDDTTGGERSDLAMQVNSAQPLSSLVPVHVPTPSDESSTASVGDDRLSHRANGPIEAVGASPAQHSAEGNVALAVPGSGPATGDPQALARDA